ncbi:putative SAM dependent methyltransferase [Phlyctema vagabunda]|uniref:SAM dependent methyltransferase n=1 Tax=Phlyctema vagabunda TaxID=108571 RepID=A0ABR4PQ69_9HELO
MEVGESGHITGLDTAPLDYGTPFNVGQSHAYIRGSSLGPRIDFVNQETSTHLESLDPRSSTMYDAASLIHSLWYFPTTQSIPALFRTLAAAKIPELYIAEYSYTCSKNSQIPHLLAAQAKAAFHSYLDPTAEDALNSNVRAALTPPRITEEAGNAGYRITRQGIITPSDDMMEGYWEAKAVAKGAMFRKRVETADLPEEDKTKILELAAQANEEMDKLATEGVKISGTMDVWWAVMELQA